MGSRRTYEVCPSMYSVAAFPSRVRAAPAKKRSWLAPTRTSSSRSEFSGLSGVAVLGFNEYVDVFFERVCEFEEK